jgi:pimeloyl-ACP methyl ester carboxylesterase
VDWLWIVAAVALTPAVVWYGGMALFTLLYLKPRYQHFAERIFPERPLFLVPHGKPDPAAEDIAFAGPDGLTLRGVYLKSPTPRRGVVLFGLEFGSTRWACLAYSRHLVEAGYDVFCFEPRNQGDSDKQDDYEPLHWVTDRDLADFRAALTYLKARPDADPRGVGLFGVSKGGTVGLIAAANDPFVRCAVVDGVYGISTTMLPFMRKWIAIYNDKKFVHKLLPDWVYNWIGRDAIRNVERERGVRFLDLARCLRRFSPRPLFMVHGGGDNYILPTMAEELFARAGTPKEFWLVEKARHNQALQVAGDEFRRRVRAFFDRHLADPTVPPPEPADRKSPEAPAAPAASPAVTAGA